MCGAVIKFTFDYKIGYQVVPSMTFVSVVHINVQKLTVYTDNFILISNVGHKDWTCCPLEFSRLKYAHTV